MTAVNYSNNNKQYGNLHTCSTTQKISTFITSVSRLLKVNGIMKPYFSIKQTKFEIARKINSDATKNNHSVKETR